MANVVRSRFEAAVSAGPARPGEGDAVMLEAVFSSIDQGFCLCEIVLDERGWPSDYRILKTNRLFESMTGLVEAEGRTALELVPDLEPYWIETYGRVAMQRETTRFQNGSRALGRWFDVFATPVEPHGRFAIVFRDVTDQQAAEEARDEALEQAAELLEELNHRVMNSLGMIASIISLESRGREIGQGKRALERVGQRVMAVAELYRTLRTGSAVNAVSAPDYLGEILDGIMGSVGGSVGAGPRLERRIAPIVLSTRIAAPLGLIVNELVTNSVKHAFGSGEGGSIDVVLETDGCDLVLRVTDDGGGIVESAKQGGAGLGQRLVASFVAQLHGSIATQSDSNGTSVTVRIGEWNTADGPQLAAVPKTDAAGETVRPLRGLTDGR